MTILTWDWDGTTGSGMPTGFEPTRIDPICRNETESGYIETSADDVRGYWLFKVEFAVIRPWRYVYLVNFFQSVRGGLPFYFRWPFDMADIPPEAEFAAPEGLNPFDSEIAPGAGEGPTHLVRWDQDQFPVKRHALVENYWQTSGAIELRQV